MRKVVLVLCISFVFVVSSVYAQYHDAALLTTDFAGELFSVSYLEGFDSLGIVDHIPNPRGTPYYYLGFSKLYRDGDASFERDYHYYKLILDSYENHDSEPYRYFSPLPGRWTLDRIRQQRRYAVSASIDAEVARYLPRTHALRRTIREYWCDISYDNVPVQLVHVMKCALIELPATSNVQYNGARVRAIAVCFPVYADGYIGQGYSRQFDSLIQNFNFKNIEGIIQAEKDRLAAVQANLIKVRQMESNKKKDLKIKIDPDTTTTTPSLKSK